MREGHNKTSDEMALDFEEWTTEEEEEVSGHSLVVLSTEDDVVVEASPIVAEVVPNHYVSPDRVATLLTRLGKSVAANYVRDRLPTTKTARSGDLGEILSTEYVDAETEFSVPIKRLRWKDHRNMAMRGDDVIGVRPPHGRSRIRFLKAETKSRVALDTATVSEARHGLSGHGELPSPHALGFVCERLHETGDEDLADLILDAQYKDRITYRQVEHLLFTFSGNAPDGFLAADLRAYGGRIPQRAVGLRVIPHQEFIATVYELVEDEDDS